MPRADQATIDLLTDYFDAMEAKDHGRLSSYYADNITLTFANAPIVTGSNAVLAQMTTLLGKVKSLAHPLINDWQEDCGVVIFEVHQHLALPRRQRGEGQRLFDLHPRRRPVHRPAHLRRQRPQGACPRFDRAGFGSSTWTSDAS